MVHLGEHLVTFFFNIHLCLELCRITSNWWNDTTSSQASKYNIRPFMYLDFANAITLFNDILHKAELLHHQL